MQKTSIARVACRQLFRPVSRYGAQLRHPISTSVCDRSAFTRLQRTPPSSSILRQVRFSSSNAETTTFKPLTDRTDNDQAQAARRKAEVEAYKAEQPSYELTFTCGKCMVRSTHRVSKHGYHKGTVLVNCPGCTNKHLISDHLRIFSDKSITLEDIMKEKGELLKKGVLGADGDVEFYDENDPLIIHGQLKAPI